MKKWLLSFALLGCGVAQAVSSSETPQRIVSTTGNASDAIARFGLADNLVAVDTTSLLPPDIMATKPKIGYRRQLSAEGILSMAPDLIVLAPDAGPPTVVKQLEGAGVELFYLKDEQTLSGINEDITRLGEVLGVPDKAAELVAQQKTQEAALENSIAAYPRPPKLVLLLDTGGGVFGLGKGSAGEHISDILGGELSLDFDGMKPLSNELIAVDQADAVLLASRSDADSEAVIQPLKAGQYEILDSHSAAQKGCVFQVNIMKTLGFGPDTAAVAQQIADQIRPCINN